MKLVTTRRLDREVMRETSVKLTCADHGQHALTSDVTLVVHVLDVNDNAPRFDVTSYGADVIENSFIGTFVTKVSAVDNDDGDNGLVHYTLDDELDRDAPGTADYRRSRQKISRQKDRGRGRSQINSRTTATRQLDHANLLVNRSDGRRTYDTTARRSSGKCAGRVNIDKDSGVVIVSGLIDFEYTPVIRCRILAIDSGSSPKTGDRFASKQLTSNERM